MRVYIAFLLVLGRCFVPLPLTIAAERPDLKVVAIQHDPAPGTSIGFSQVYPTGIAADGTVVFTGRLQHDATTDTFPDGIWLYKNGDSQLIAERGTLVPGQQDNQVFGWFHSPVRIADEGLMTILSHTGTAGDDPLRQDTIWLSNGIEFQSIATTNQGISNLPGAAVEFLQLPSLSDSGQVVFLATLTGPAVAASNDSAVLAYRDGALVALVREGDQLPDGSVALAGLSFSQSRSGLVAINNATSIWSGPPGQLQLHVQEDQPASGLGPNVSFGELFYAQYGIDDAGVLITEIDLVGPDVDLSNNTSIWQGPAGDMQLVLREGDAAPGTDAMFDDLFGVAIARGVNGDSVYECRLRGAGVDPSSNIGIWRNSDEGLELIVRNGMAAPGLDQGVHFKVLSYMSNVNSHGEFAFQALLDGDGVESWNDESIWYFNPQEGPRLVLREGDWPDGTSENQSLTMFELFNSRLNDRGELLFSSFLVDRRSGAFVLAVPEPSSLTIVGCICVTYMFFAKYRRRVYCRGLIMDAANWQRPNRRVQPAVCGLGAGG